MTVTLAELNPLACVIVENSLIKFVHMLDRVIQYFEISTEKRNVTMQWQLVRLVNNMCTKLFLTKFSLRNCRCLLFLSVEVELQPATISLTWRK